MANLVRDELKKMHPNDLRAYIRRGEFKDHTMGVSEGYLQANLIILQKKYTFDFMLFCQRNPAPIPLLEVTELGVSKLKYLAQDADLKSDLPQYRVFVDGECIDEPYDIYRYWKDDFRAFLTGCSFSLDHVLVSSNITLRHMIQEKVPSCFITNMKCQKAGPFYGPLVVTLRPIKKSELVRVVQLASRYPLLHGSPAHIGDPSEIGIEDINRVDWGDPVEVKKDEVPVFWACGLTSHVVCLRAKPEIMITHYPGKLLIADRLISQSALIS